MLTLGRAVALSLLLLLTQHGGVRHAVLVEASGQQTSHRDEPAHADGDGPCDICQVFAQVANPISAVGSTACLRGDLTFGLSTARPTDARRAAPPAERSRGPPLLA